MNALRVILGDQLSVDVATLADLDRDRDTVLMMEVIEECAYVRHHKQKIALVLSSMRHFADALCKRGVTVDYIKARRARQYPQSHWRSPTRGHSASPEPHCGDGPFGMACAGDDRGVGVADGNADRSPRR
jgi:hypothetical protein